MALSLEYGSMYEKCELYFRKSSFELFSWFFTRIPAHWPIIKLCISHQDGGKGVLTVGLGVVEAGVV